MMDPLLLRKQLQDNNSDLQDYFKDIQAWGEEMKRKEAANSASSASEEADVPLPRNKIPKTQKKPDKTIVQSEVNTTKVPKDFTYWEKFDVEAECEKIDKAKSDEDSDLTDEHDEAAFDLAQEEKDKGNKFVKAGRWKDALKCYTQAIANYNYDATFYANRALCHLKLDQHKSAEADCTIAIQLDNAYVKALHRRALAREALKQYREAKDDLERLLVIEPENKESQKLLDKIEIFLKPEIKQQAKVENNFQRPISKFTASRQNKPVQSVSASNDYDGPPFKELVVERKRPATPTTTKTSDPLIEGVFPKVSPHKSSGNINYFNNILWPAGEGSDVEIVKTLIKIPKDRSTLPLRRIKVCESLKLHAKP